MIADKICFKKAFLSAAESILAVEPTKPLF
jgi:hypothetical protein